MCNKKKLFYSIDMELLDKLEFPKEFDKYIYTRISIFENFRFLFSFEEDGEYVL
jgi:hypothetical protein